MLVETFGFLSVSAMVVFYALESRSRNFVLAFAGACLSAAIYAAVIRSWPFAVVESIWSVIALNRWRLLLGADQPNV